MIKRRNTRKVMVGDVAIGGGSPVSIQSMTNTDTMDVSKTVGQIHRLEAAGCEIVRVAVRTPDAASAISEIKKEINIPLVADIHFDRDLALRSIRAGADKIRINPGNMRRKEDVKMIIEAAGAKGIPMRAGINSGSLMEMADGRGAPPVIMADALSSYLDIFYEMGYKDIVLSLKASEVGTTVQAYRIMAERCDHPFHVGVTASGPMSDGIVRSSMGIGALLLDGLADTIRVSLTGAPEHEIDTAKRILSASGTREFGARIISCPTCGRCGVDLVPMVERLERELEALAGETGKDMSGLTIAVMGCEVNGPGEARMADFGVAFGKGRGALFSRGEVLGAVDADKALDELVMVIRKGMTG